MTKHDARIAQLRDWLTQQLALAPTRIEPASADASFRRYFRVWDRHGATRIAMDAPPEHEDLGAYLHVARLLQACEVHVPRIDAADRKLGFALLEDLGSSHYLERLTAGADAGALYGEALGALLRIQARGRTGAAELAPYDRAALERELALMPEWFCGRHLGLTLDDGERSMLADAGDLLVREALAQPTVLVHRDYHSRNLMVLAAQGPGILDFQDALHGPITYDLVSLLKDCYVAWPRTRVLGWVESYRRALRDAGLECGADQAEFVRWFDLIGLQRHLKVLGIFARLWYRDGKRGYLADLPRTLQYARETAAQYRQLHVLSRWLERRIAPRLPEANARALAAERA